MKRVGRAAIGVALIALLVFGPAVRCSGAGLAFPTSVTPAMTADERSGVIHGAILGAFLGTYASAFPVLAEGAANGASGALPWIAVGFGLGAVLGGMAGYAVERQWPSMPTAPRQCRGYSLIEPCSNQFQVRIENMSGFTLPGSRVNVREFELRGSGLHFNDIGLGSEQVPSLDAAYWFNDRDAIRLRVRYFDLGGSFFLPRPTHYNGATLRPGPLDTTPFPWFSGGVYYERRFAPWYKRFESSWPAALKGWDFRGQLGIEYNYIYFSFDNAHAPVEPHSGTETGEDFYHQSMPLPTIGLVGYRRLGRNFTLETSVEGYWLNRWNSLRSEGGTVWATQYGGEAHARIYYRNPAWLGPLRLMAGSFVYYYSQLEDSHEDGNFLQWGMAGVEYGVVWVF